MSTTHAFRRLLPTLLLLVAVRPAFGQTIFWESPQTFVPRGMTHSTSAVGKSIIALAWQEIRPRSETDRTSGDISLSMAVSNDGITWTTHARFFPPIHYTGVTEGNEPRVYSMTIDARDRILVAVSLSDHNTAILMSSNSGATFQQLARVQSRGVTGNPSLFATGGNGLLLLMSEGSSDAVTLAYSHSPDGRSWSDMAPLVSETDGVASPQLQASHATLGGREYIVFQALKKITAQSGISSWQLYLKSSADNGATWGKATEITTASPVFGEQPQGFNNQRPRIAALGGQLGLVWERSQLGNDKRPTISSIIMEASGAITGGLESPASEPPARFPHILFLRGQEYVLYSQGQTSRITLAQKKGKVWDASPLQNVEKVEGQSAVFPHAVVFNGSPFIFWENQSSEKLPDSLVTMRPLTSVGAPVLKPDFTPGQLGSRNTLRVDWSEPQPPDPAGIKEYRYTWTWSDGVTTVVKNRDTASMTANDPRRSEQKIDVDGTWTFSVVAVDFAGNTSTAPASVSFIRDATPPRPVTFEVLGKDGKLLLTEPPTEPENRDANSFVLDTNTFRLRWIPAADKDIVGYTINMQPGWATLDDYRQSKVPLQPPPARVVTTTQERQFFNEDNGVYAVTVQAIDKAGNLSSPSTIALALTGYQLVTQVYSVDRKRDPQLGTVKLTIFGRGFTENGTLKKVILDRRGSRNPPWDIEFDASGLTNVTDRVIAGITMDENRESGTYRVGLLQERPTGEVLYFAPDTIDFRSPGTVKIGNFELPLPRWIVGGRPQYEFSFNSMLVVLLVAFLGVLSFLSARKIFALAREGAVVRAEVIALLEGRPNAGWVERKNKMQALKRKGAGLRLKFILLTVVLVTLIVLAVSIPLGLQAVNRQTQALASGLQNQANILMDALAASAETQFRLGETGFEGALGMTKLRSAMAEATYTTITGPDPVANPGLKPTDPKDYVWASDQQRFVDELGRGQFHIAKETVADDLARNIAGQLQKQIDGDAVRKLSSVIDQYRSLSAQYKSLLDKNDAASKTQRDTVNAQLKTVADTVDTQTKAEFGRGASLPVFDPNKALAPTYLFYRPIIYYNNAALEADTTFYQGLIRLEVKTAAITRQISESIRAIFRTAGAIALAAIGLGVLGAIIMANITVTPIRKLAAGVAKIRDTKDKEQLKDPKYTIVLSTRDEIGDLADTVNEMTADVARAAAANKELMLGKDVQMMFLPLEKDRAGKKGSTAEENTKNVEIYGYYEGAAEVSGDYFDFKPLDETHYLLIKCDVSGHGVSAGLIMVEVATLFINHCNEWKRRKDSLAQIKDPGERKRLLSELERLDALVYTINGMLEERGFKGLFAAFTICLFNTVTGDITVCPAGDNELHIYDVSKKRMVHDELTPKEKGSPAAGVFPNMLVEMKSGFPQFPIKLDHGDVLFLPTDGVDEAKRLLRNESFEVITCQEPGLKEGEYHLKTHKFGTDNEDFGKDRMDDFITGVFNKSRVSLVRHHNPIPNEELQFDFSTCEGTVREAVLAVVSAEKVFRMVLDPKAGDGNTVRVDAKIDAFLKKHFLQYERYFSHRIEGQPDEPYVHFSHLVEDEQRDDLTILVVRRK
jgi:HAMP domain-containing protein